MNQNENKFFFNNATAAHVRFSSVVLDIQCATHLMVSVYLFISEGNARGKVEGP